MPRPWPGPPRRGLAVGCACLLSPLHGIHAVPQRPASARRGRQPASCVCLLWLPRPPPRALSRCPRFHFRFSGLGLGNFSAPVSPTPAPRAGSQFVREGIPLAACIISRQRSDTPGQPADRSSPGGVLLVPQKGGAVGPGAATSTCSLEGARTWQACRGGWDPSRVPPAAACSMWECFKGP